jgi:hypothetical protein
MGWLKKYQSGGKKLQSGVVVDKEKNMAKIYQNFVPVDSFPAITGKNSLKNTPNLVTDPEVGYQPRNTPVGQYIMQPGKVYGKPGYHLVNPKLANIAWLHTTFDPANRAASYNNPNPRARDLSYGCVNCRDEDIAKIYKHFPQGDTLQVLPRNVRQEKKEPYSFGSPGPSGLYKDEELNYQNGGYSTTGYKADSPDRNNPYNIIPSGRITMQNVPHPVLGIDNFGNKQMMQPGGEYQFQGDRVFEVPVMQGGGVPPYITNNPNDPRIQASADSLKLYNSYQELKNKLRQNNYVNVPTIFFDRLTEADVIKEANRDKSKDNWTDRHIPNPFSSKENIKRPWIDASKEGNLYKALDFYPGEINKDLGHQYFSTTIRPKSEESWRKHRFFGDARLIYNYENVQPKQQVIYQAALSNQRQQPVLQQTKTQVPVKPPVKQRELVARVPVTDIQQYPVTQQGQQYMIPAPIPASPYDINVHQWDPALLGRPDQVKSFMTKEQLEDWKKANQAHYLQGNRYEVGMNQVPSQDDAFTSIEQMKEGGIPQRYKTMGFTHVGQKKSGDGQHKWKVLAKKGDSYKVVQGGYRGMQDFKQHHSEERKDRFWDRMGGRNSSKAKDPFSPLYWHKRFGTWEYGGTVEMQKGGLPPIYVDSPSDPRYRAYQDSLDAYNTINPYATKDLKKAGFSVDTNEWNDFSNKIKDSKTNKKIPVGKLNKGFYSILNNKDVSINYKGIKPSHYIQMKRSSEDRPLFGDDYSSLLASGDDYWYGPYFKAPVQPIKIIEQQEERVPANLSAPNNHVIQRKVQQINRLPVSSVISKSEPYSSMSVEVPSYSPVIKPEGWYTNNVNVPIDAEDVSALYNEDGSQKYKQGGMIKRADGSYSQRGLWDNIRANAGSGKQPTKEMLQQEKKIRSAEKKYGGWLNQYQDGGWKADSTSSIDMPNPKGVSVSDFPNTGSYQQPSLLDVARMTSAAGSLVPHPYINIPSRVVNSAIGLYDAYNEYQNNDKEKAAFDFVTSTLPWMKIPASTGLKGEKFIPKKVAKYNKFIKNVDHLGTADDMGNTWLQKYQNGGLATISPVSTTGTSIGTSTISGTPTINKNLLQLRQWADQSSDVKTPITPNPSYRNKLVQDQVDYVMQNRAKNDTLPFAVVDKKSNNIAYYDRYGKIKGFEPVITGADNKDVDVAPSMKEFNAMYNVKGNKDYFNYLKATGQKITPAGIYTAHLRENQLDEPGNRAVHYVKNLLNPSREEEVKAHRVEAYGPQNKIFTLTDESGRGISKAIHGTGYDERIEALNNPNIRNKDLSNGCINVGGKTICFDALRSNSKVYILPEETDNIVKYKPASTTSKVVPQAIAKKKQGGWLQKY